MATISNSKKTAWTLEQLYAEYGRHLFEIKQQSGDYAIVKVGRQVFPGDQLPNFVRKLGGRMFVFDIEVWVHLPDDNARQWAQQKTQRVRQ